MDKINNFLNNVFASLPNTKDVVDLKKSIEQGMVERFQDLLKEGKSEAEAFGIVVSDFGNVEDIRRELNLEDHYDSSVMEDIYLQDQNKRKFNQKFGIAITSGVLFCIWGVFGSGILAMLEVFPPLMVLNFFGFISAGVGLFIYWGIAYSNFEKGESIYNPDFQQSQSRHHSKMVSKLSAIVFPSTVLIYLIIGLFFGGWHPWWILFPASGIVMSVIKALSYHE